MLSQYTQGRENNLNLVRFILSVMVIYSHSYPLSNGPAASDRVKEWVGFSLGDFAVNAFFVISGFLITKSFIRRRSLGQFCLSRVARIYPALVIANIFCVAVVGFLQTSFSTQDYFTSRLTLNYAPKNLLLLPHKMQFALPGVFEDAPYASIVNGSIWTLPYEMMLYVAIAVLGSLGLWTKRWMVLTLCLGVGVCYLQWSAEGFHTLRFAIFGCLGSLFYILETRISTSKAIFATTLCLGIAISAVGRPEIGVLLLASYCVLWLGFVPSGKVRSFNQLGDYSYGMYIFAYPVQQSIVNLVSSVAPMTLFYLSTLLTLPLAVLSWHMIEKPVLERIKDLPIIRASSCKLA